MKIQDISNEQETDVNEKANKELDNLIDWVAHNGGWANKPVNRAQHEERTAILNKKLKTVRAVLNK